MSNAHASYTNQKGEELTLTIDFDLKTESVREFRTKGQLKSKYAEELKELEDLVSGKTLSEILQIKRSQLKREVLLQSGQKALAPLSLWLLHRAIEDYLGTASTLEEQSDVLCLCFGVGKNDLKKQILSRADYDLPQLIAETFATSACGSCLSIIKKTLSDLRLEHGLILGMDHSKTRFDKNGHWLKIKGLYPAELIVMLDDLLHAWMKREGIINQYKIEITDLVGHHLSLSVKETSKENQAVSVEAARAEKILQALSDYLKSETGILFFLHLVF